MLCSVGEGIGLNLSPAEAETVIEVLIGVIIGAFILLVLFFGGCMAYRSRYVTLQTKPTKEAALPLKDVFYTYSNGDYDEELSSKL